MNPPKFARTLLAAAATLLFANPTYAAAPRQAPHRDAQHDFDFHFGTWLTHIRALGARGQWTHMTGTVTDLPVWHGRANLEKILAAPRGSARDPAPAPVGNIARRCVRARLPLQRSAPRTNAPHEPLGSSHPGVTCAGELCY